MATATQARCPTCTMPMRSALQSECWKCADKTRVRNIRKPCEVCDKMHLSGGPLCDKCRKGRSRCAGDECPNWTANGRGLCAVCLAAVEAAA